MMVDFSGESFYIATYLYLPDDGRYSIYRTMVDIAGFGRQVRFTCGVFSKICVKVCLVTLKIIFFLLFLLSSLLIVYTRQGLFIYFFPPFDIIVQILPVIDITNNLNN